MIFKYWEFLLNCLSFKFNILILSKISREICVFSLQFSKPLPSTLY